MDEYIIKKDDIKNRIYFITKLVQNHNGSTMQGALTSKSDSMGGIFDRFINTLSDSLVFDKIIFKKPAFKKLGKEIKSIEDFYYYKPLSSLAGIAPDIFGVKFNNKVYPFTRFDNKWKAVANTPQIEIKTSKAKDQMISLRNQNYDNEYLVFVDLDIRIDYLVPFLDEKYLNDTIINSMKMDDKIFIINDDNKLISRITPINYSEKEIGKIQLVLVTKASDFMKQSTLCGSNISVWRMKEIKERGAKLVNNLLDEKLKNYADLSKKVKSLYAFNGKWKNVMGIIPNVQCLDFSAENIDEIKIIKFNKKGMVITTDADGCTFNGTKLEKMKQYSVSFEVLDRSGNKGEEYFMQKQCVCYLQGCENDLINEILNVIK